MTIWDIFAAIAPELILAIGATDLLLLAAFSRNPNVIRTISISAIVLLLLATASLLGPASTAGDLFGGQFRADAFAAFAKVVIFLASAVAIAMAPGFLKREGEAQGEYPVLILFAAIGMSIMVSAGDLLMLYVGLELQSLSAYVLASFLRRDTRSAEAGLKYFVLGALASGILLYGISLLYGFTGTTLFDGIAVALADGVSTGELFGIVFVLGGLAFKISAVPFHMWTPDVYEGAPTPVTAFFASAPKVAAMALLVRVAVEAMGPATFEWRQIVIFMALASTVLGGVAAIGQKNIKRLLAYSSINNIGFALVGLAAGTPAGVASVLFYMAVYVVMTLGAFLVVLRMRDAADGRPVEEIASLAGLSRTRPWLAAAMAMFMFSLAGIPPLFGFWPKFLVFQAAVAADLTWLAAVAIATSVIGAYYYIMIVKLMFFDEAAPAFAPTREPIGAGLILASALFVSPLGYLAIPALGQATQVAAASLF
jgi:NADH-quinone oxidoreductase subunit N